MVSKSSAALVIFFLSSLNASRFFPQYAFNGSITLLVKLKCNASKNVVKSLKNSDVYENIEKSSLLSSTSARLLLISFESACKVYENVSPDFTSSFKVFPNFFKNVRVFSARFSILPTETL